MRWALDGLIVAYVIAFLVIPVGSIVLTSNKSYGEWGEVFSGDTVIATAILDRLLHHSTTISIKGESYRLKDKKKAGIITTPAG